MRRRNRILLLLGVAVLIASVLALSPPGRSSLNRVRPLGLRILVALGINDPLRYRVHMLSGDVAMRLGFTSFAAERYHKAAGHARGEKQSLTLTLEGEALLSMGKTREARQVLQWAVDIDRFNERAWRSLGALPPDDTPSPLPECSLHS